MTKEEAIVILKNISWQMGSVEREQNIEAINMAIEALSFADRLQGEQIDDDKETTSMVSNQIEELRKYARKWSEWNGFNAAMPVLPCTNIRLLHSAADTIEVLDRPIGKWINQEKCQVDEDAYEVATCSECGAEITIEYPHDSYCPNCGAYMKEGNNE